MSDINSEEKKNTPIKEFSYLEEAFLPGTMLFFFPLLIEVTTGNKFNKRNDAQSTRSSVLSGAIKSC